MIKIDSCCHCTDCQNLSGTAFRTAIPLPGASFNFSAAEPTIYVKIAESSNKREQAF